MGAGARYGLPEEPHASDDGAQVPGSRGRPADGAHLARREHGLPAPAVGLFLEHKDALNAALMLIDARSLACLSVSAPALPDRGARLRSRMAGAPRGCVLRTSTDMTPGPSDVRCPWSDARSAARVSHVVCPGRRRPAVGTALPRRPHMRQDDYPRHGRVGRMAQILRN
jgi:hypothetical protein